MLRTEELRRMKVCSGSHSEYTVCHRGEVEAAGTDLIVSSVTAEAEAMDAW